MKVRMLTHYSRAADGINVIRYLGGEKYDLPEAEARLFIEIGVAIEDKDMGAAPETKGGVWIAQDDIAPIYAQEPTPAKKGILKKRRK